MDPGMGPVCGGGAAAASRALSPICSADLTRSGPAVSVMAAPLSCYLAAPLSADSSLS